MFFASKAARPGGGADRTFLSPIATGGGLLGSGGAMSRCGDSVWVAACSASLRRSCPRAIRRCVAATERCPRRFLSWMKRPSLLGVRVDRAASSCQVAAGDARERRFQPLVSVEDVSCVDQVRFSQSFLSCQEQSDHWPWLCQLRSDQLGDLFHGSEWPVQNLAVFHSLWYFGEGCH